MIRREQLPELDAFALAERDLPLRVEPTFGPLVVPNGNGSAAGHRWFKYKEAFSSDLLDTLLPTLSPHNSDQPIRVLDPYCGVGTSLLSAQTLSRPIDAIGIECNPFSAFVAQTKVLWPEMDGLKIRKMAANILGKDDFSPVELPELSSITTGRCITRRMAEHIVRVRRTLERLPKDANRDALMLGLASAIEPVSRIRRDGRALRLVDKRRVTFRNVLFKKWAAIADDVDVLHDRHQSPNTVAVRSGDGRTLAGACLEDGSIDLIVTSPPYPNNIDYNEVYKLELWFLGFTDNAKDFLDLRRATFRSHPTCSPIPTMGGKYDDDFRQLMERGRIAELIGSVVERVGGIEQADKRGRSKVLQGYIYDCWQSLTAHYRVLKSGGKAAYVVGNSLHGGAETPYLVPTDLILAQLGRIVGFHVDDMIVARGLQRRLAGNHFLRDTIVVLRKS